MPSAALPTRPEGIDGHQHTGADSLFGCLLGWPKVHNFADCLVSHHERGHPSPRPSRVAVDVRATDADGASAEECLPRSGADGRNLLDPEDPRAVKHSAFHRWRVPGAGRREATRSHVVRMYPRARVSPSKPSGPLYSAESHPS